MTTLRSGDIARARKKGGLKFLYPKILTRAGYELDKDMDAALWEGKYHVFERILLDAKVSEAGLSLVIEEEKTAGKLPASFSMKEILLDRFAKEAADSVDWRFGSGCE